MGTAFFALLGVVSLRGGSGVRRFNRRSGGWLFAAALFNTRAILSFFSTLNVGKIGRVEPLVACNPLLTILWAAILLRQIEQISGHVVVGALVTVTGTILVVTAR